MFGNSFEYLRPLTYSTSELMLTLTSRHHEDSTQQQYQSEPHFHLLVSSFSALCFSALRSVLLRLPPAITYIRVWV